MAKLDQVERKLVELERMRRALLQVASLCTGEGPASACPMLDALDQQEQFERTIHEKEDTSCQSTEQPNFGNSSASKSKGNKQ